MQIHMLPPRADLPLEARHLPVQSHQNTLHGFFLLCQVPKPTPSCASSLHAPGVAHDLLPSVAPGRALSITKGTQHRHARGRSRSCGNGTERAPPPQASGLEARAPQKLFLLPPVFPSASPPPFTLHAFTCRGGVRGGYLSGLQLW